MPDPELVAKCRGYLESLHYTTWSACFWLVTDEQLTEASEFFASQIEAMEELWRNRPLDQEKDSSDLQI